MQNVAAYAGVSVATVSKVMQGDETVRPENVVAVQNAIEALGYRINPVAAELRRGRRKLIGVVVASLDDKTTALVRAMERHAQKKGYSIWVECSDGSEERESLLLGRFKDWRVAGFILMRVHAKSSGPELLLGDSAVVIVDGGASAPFDGVDVTFEGASGDLVDGLIAAGHRSLLIVNQRGDAERTIALAAHLRTLWKTRCAVSDAVCEEIEGGSAVAASRLGQRFAQLDRPIAAVTLCRMAEYLVAAYAAARDWTTPNDLRIIPYRPTLRAVTDAWSSMTLEYPADAMAVKSVDLLLARIDWPRSPRTILTEPLRLSML